MIVHKFRQKVTLSLAQKKLKQVDNFCCLRSVITASDVIVDSLKDNY